MNLRQIEIVNEVARTRNFTKAAEHLYMSQPALSSQIKALEKELGFAIFTRNRKRAVDITEGGAIFLMHAQKIAADMNRMYLNLGMYRPGASGEIRIGLFLTFGYTRVADIIKQFRAAYPDIKLIFRIDTSIGLVERVRAGELDVAMAVDCDPSILPDDEQFPHYLISCSPLCAVVEKSHRLAQHSSIAFTDLNGEQIIMVSRNSPSYRMLMDTLRALDADPVIIGETSQADAIIQLAETGIAIGFLSRECHDRYGSQNTVAIPLYPTINRTVSFVCNRESRNIRWSKMLRDFAIDTLRGSADAS
jgi:DNA-binding transcriptional LysR family regulator